MLLKFRGQPPSTALIMIEMMINLYLESGLKCRYDHWHQFDAPTLFGHVERPLFEGQQVTTLHVSSTLGEHNYSWRVAHGSSRHFKKKFLPMRGMLWMPHIIKILLCQKLLILSINIKGVFAPWVKNDSIAAKKFVNAHCGTKNAMI